MPRNPNGTTDIQKTQYLKSQTHEKAFFIDSLLAANNDSNKKLFDARFNSTNAVNSANSPATSTNFEQFYRFYSQLCNNQETRTPNEELDEDWKKEEYSTTNNSFNEGLAEEEVDEQVNNF